MYSREVIQRKINAYSAKTGRELIYYSPSYIEACTSHLEGLAERDSKIKFINKFAGTSRPLTEDENAFIQNERILCALDYHHWATNYHRIRHAETLEMIPFLPNRYQQVLNLVQARMEADGVPIEIQLLKARQGGGTTDTTSKIQHRAQFVPSTSGVIASADPDKSWKLSEMLSRSLKLQPWFLLSPTLMEYGSGEVFLEDKERNISVAIQHGAQEGGIVQGDTVNIAHFSELPYFRDAEKTIEMGFDPAHHPSEITLIVYESTADGRGNWWHRFWERNKIRYPNHESIILPLFLPWYLSRDIYPTDGWLKGMRAWDFERNTFRPPDKFKVSDYAAAHAKSAEEYVRTNTFLREVMGADWSMPLEQIFWYQTNYEQARQDDKLAVFLATVPATDTEAFQSKAKSIFSIELIQEYQARVPLPVGVYKLSGTGIPDRLLPDRLEAHPDAQTVTVEYTSAPLDNAGPAQQCKWSLLPIIFPGYASVKSHLNTLWIWEYPQDNQEYCISLDAGEGLKRDRTVATVLRKGTPARCAGQVAMFSSDTMEGSEFWPICLMLLAYYSPWATFNGGTSPALFSPEIASDGGTIMNEVRKRGWSNIYFMRQVEYRDQTADRITKIGWRTTGTTRRILVSWLTRILKGFFIELNSYWTIDEMRSFVAKDPPPSSRYNVELKIEHDKDSHDDELFSLAIALVTLHELEIFQGQTPFWASLVSSLQEMITFPLYRDHVPGAAFKVEEFLEEGWAEEHGEVLYPTAVPERLLAPGFENFED